MFDPGDPDHKVVDDNDAFVDVALGWIELVDTKGRYLAEKDYRVSGEVWRVHKGDADPFPSRPHAHCVGGAKRYIGCTVHLGTGELFRSATGTGLYLSKKQFARLIELIQPKFPDIELPLPTN